MPSHSYSTVLYDLTWQDIGDAINTVEQLDGISGVALRATFDTSGGTLEDGTEYQTEATLTATYEYELGNGDAALTELANAISQLSVVDTSVSQLEYEIKQRG
jgi:hypothetical protein